MGAHENRWQDKEGETGEKRAGCGSQLFDDLCRKSTRII